jgi:hypothetical protein
LAEVFASSIVGLFVSIDVGSQDSIAATWSGGASHAASNINKLMKMWLIAIMRNI